MDKLVFVYGTLMTGHSNHHLLEGSRFAGETSIKGWEMRDVGFYPAITKSEGGHVHGEMYIVSDEVFADLDRLEGYPGHYNKTVTKTELGWDVWVYYYKKSTLPVIESGRWTGRRLVN